MEDHYQEPQVKPVSFTAIFNNAKTTTDGGWRLTLDLDQSEYEAIQKIVELRECVLRIVVMNNDKL